MSKQIFKCKQNITYKSLILDANIKIEISDIFIVSIKYILFVPKMFSSLIL